MRFIFNQSSTDTMNLYHHLFEQRGRKARQGEPGGGGCYWPQSPASSLHCRLRVIHRSCFCLLCCACFALLCGRCIWLPAAVTPVTCLALWSDQEREFEIFAHCTNAAGEYVPASEGLMLV